MTRFRMMAEPCRAGLVVYREYYGMQPGKPNVGLKLPAEEVAREIVRRETARTLAGERASRSAFWIRLHSR